MKKFIITVCVIVVCLLLLDYLYYYQGVYIDFAPGEASTTFVCTQGEKICLDRGDGPEEFEIKGVDLGSGIPGQWSTSFAATKADYLRWFQQIRQMGANTIRVYTINNDVFYNALYEFNKDNPQPLYLLQGVWVNDYLYSSSQNAYDSELIDTFIYDCKVMIDVLHGNRKLQLGRNASSGHGTYNKDVSPWVIGYILGIEWDDLMVVYTNEKFKNDEKYNSYQGKYMFTTQDATPFEAMLAKVGDQLLEYETARYKTQKLVAFSNSPTTDPFLYPDYLTDYFNKCTTLDVEHIRCTEAVISGHFASYHVYPYDRDYLAYVTDFEALPFAVDVDACYEDGVLDTYKLYLKALADHHAIPVVISEFGVSTGRGMAQLETEQGFTSEARQGAALVDCYNDIMEAGCAGSCLASWQDEWYKRPSNTTYAVDFMRTPYWWDVQANEECFGLLAFDPGAEKTVCYIDGDVSEWSETDRITENGDLTLSVKYDEAYVYLLVQKKNLDFRQETLYIPLDITPKSGSRYCDNSGLLFDRAADFLITLNGSENSKIQVQERYEVLRSNYAKEVYGFDTYVKGNIPSLTSPKFVDINLLLQASSLEDGQQVQQSQVFQTGKLTYGNGNPQAENYDSLADFICSGDYVELRIPWQLLNFSDPSRLQIHDDYYAGNYGVEPLCIDRIYLGISTGNTAGRIHLEQVMLQGWDNQVTYHERLKPAYYVMQQLWREADEG